MGERANAKLNLALHVRARQPDGYHTLETLFAFVADGDLLYAAPAPAFSLSIDGPFAEGLEAGAGNLVLRAAAALAAAARVAEGAALRLEKRLPVASGIGGGSADAAATLRLLNRLWQLDWPVARLAELGAALGADVAACVHNRTLRGEGRGDRLDPVACEGLTDMPVLLVNPRVAVSTGPVFSGWDGIDRGPLATGDLLEVSQGARNDLEPSARRIAPVIGQVLTALGRSDGAHLVRMSGSGATCFALFDDVAARDRADQVIAADHPGWWRMASTLL